MRYISTIAAAAAPLSLLIGSTLSLAESSNSSYNIDESNDKLCLVQVVFRHGARTPLTNRHEFWTPQKWTDCSGPIPYGPQSKILLQDKTGQPSAPHPHNLKQMQRRLEGNCFQGQLTNIGHQQAYDLGSELRRKYIDKVKLLDPHFLKEEVEARTTNFQRTINTLQGVLSGIYPNLPNSNIIVPVLTSGETDEILYADSKSCPHLGTFLEASKALIRSQLRGANDLGLLASKTKEEMKRILNLDDAYFDRSWTWSDIHDAMTSMRTHGKKIPEELVRRPELLEAVDRLATKEFSAFVAPSIQDEHGKAILRLSMGVLLHTLIENIESKIRSKAGPKLYLYSGHDSSVMPVLAALGVSIDSWPPYCSNVVIELWERRDGQHVVRCFFNHEEISIPHVPRGSHPTLETFKTEVLGPFILSQEKWGAACQVKVTHEGSLPGISVMADEE